MHNDNAFFCLQKKRIMLPDSFRWWSFRPSEFKTDCPQFADKCEFIEQKRSAKEKVDAIVRARDGYHRGSNTAVPDDALRYFFILESNFVASASLSRQKDVLTAFWRGSGIIAPYGRWAYYDPAVQRLKQGSLGVVKVSKNVDIYLYLHLRLMSFN
jgi:hypothetical protein